MHSLEHRNRFLAGIALLILLGSPACTRDPEKAKQRYFESGQRYLEKGEYEEARIEFLNALKIDPRFLEAHYRLGLTCVSLRRWAEAHREFTAVLELDPKHRDARLRLADLILAGGDTVAARQEIEQLLALDDADVEARSLQGRAYMAEKDFARAIVEFEKTKQLAPLNPVFWIASGVAKIGARQFKQAEEDLRKAIEMDRAAVDAYRNLANLYYLSGRSGQTEPLLRKAIEINPHSLDLYLVLAESYYQQARIDAVEQLLSEAVLALGDSPRVHLEFGDFWMWRHELVRAAAEFERVLRKEESVLAQKKLISAYITLRRWDEAQRLNEQILAKNPRDLEGRTFRAALQHLRGHSDVAVRELQEVSSEDPRSILAHYYLGLALKATGKLQEAERAFVQCIRLNEKFVHPYEQLAELRLQQKDPKLALEYAKKAVVLAPLRYESNLLLAQGLLAAGEPGRAEQVLRRVIQAMPKSPAARELLASVYMAQQKVTAALREYKSVWELDGRSIESLGRFADLFASYREVDSALRVFEELIEQHPQVDYYELAAGLYLRKGDLERAKQTCRQALVLEPSRWIAHFHLGEIHRREGRREEAIVHYGEVIRHQPLQIPAYILAGDIRMREGRFAEARAYYQAALQKAPESVLAQHSLARLWAEEGVQLDEALALVQRLLAKFPDDPHLVDTLAWIYYRKGMHQSSLSLLKRCVEQEPRNALFHLHLGLTYWSLGEIRSSHQALETALKLGLESARWESTAREVMGKLTAGR